MPDDLTAPTKSSVIKNYLSWPNLQRAAEIALQQRRATGEIMTYHEDGWVVREYPGQRIVRLAPIDQFKAEDFPSKHEHADRVRRAERLGQEQ